MPVSCKQAFLRMTAIAQRQPEVTEDVIKTAVWWHAQAGMYAAAERTVFGVDA